MHRRVLDGTMGLENAPLISSFLTVFGLGVHLLSENVDNGKRVNGWICLNSRPSCVNFCGEACKELELATGWIHRLTVA